MTITPFLNPSNTSLLIRSIQLICSILLQHHFKTFQVFLIYFPKCSHFSTRRQHFISFFLIFKSNLLVKISSLCMSHNTRSLHLSLLTRITSNASFYQSSDILAYLYQGCTNPGRPKFARRRLLFSAQLLPFKISPWTQKQVSLGMYRAASAR
jgi:hypothetical protein